MRTATLLVASLAAVALLTRGAATTQSVDSVAALQRALNAAAPGDTILMPDGTYDASQPIAVACAGAAGRPITISAAHVGGVTLGGAGGFEVKAPAAYVVIRGFVFTHAAGRETVAPGASHVRFTRDTFVCAGEGAYLTVSGDDVEVDHNEFRDKHTLGNMISVTGRGHQVARRLWIHHNYFHDFTNGGGNGAETIRFGLSGLSMSHGDGLVEYNLFVRCTGENELISNKSCRNTYRYNTFLDSRGAQLTLRHGNECLVYGNIFRGLDGLRIFGDRHRIFSNYFEGNTRGINLGNGDGEVADGAKLTSHDRPDDDVIAFNTFVNNRETYEMDGRNHGLGATRTTFAYNVIVGGGKVADIRGPNGGAIWRGNVCWQTGPTGDLPATGFTTENPQLAPDAAGIDRPAPSSPIVAAVADPFHLPPVDLDGQPRPAQWTLGADEPSPAPALAHLLTPADVGPAAR